MARPWPPLLLQESQLHTQPFCFLCPYHCFHLYRVQSASSKGWSCKSILLECTSSVTSAQSCISAAKSGSGRRGKVYLTYSFEGDAGIVMKNGLVPAHSSSSEPHVSLLLQQAQHLLGHITDISLGCPKENFFSFLQELSGGFHSQAGWPPLDNVI